MIRKPVFYCIGIALFFFSLPPSVRAQQNGTGNTPPPSGYGGLELGMDTGTVKGLLEKNASLYGYRGERDIWIPEGWYGDSRERAEWIARAKKQNVIQTETRSNSSFFRSCYFEFQDEKLYIITLNLNGEKTDYYSVFSALCGKYGQPASLNPQKAEWKSDTVIFTLEKPLTLKYIDRAVFDKLQDGSRVEDSEQKEQHKNFLESL